MPKYTIVFERPRMERATVPIEADDLQDAIAKSEEHFDEARESDLDWKLLDVMPQGSAGENTVASLADESGRIVWPKALSGQQHDDELEVAMRRFLRGR